MATSCEKYYETILELVTSKGSKIVTKKKDYINLLEISKNKTKVKIEWTCSQCKKVNLSMISQKNFSGLCRSCGIKKAKGMKTGKIYTYDSFVTDLENEGWVMLSSRAEYKNTKSEMRVINDYAKEQTTTYWRWNKGCRSKQAASNSNKKNFDDVTALFNSKGFELLSDKDEYIDKNSKLRFRCSCGNESTVSYQGMKIKKFGCKDCEDKNNKMDWETIVKFFDDNDCVIISSSDVYKNNLSYLEFICSCGNDYGLIQWKNFRKGARCLECLYERKKKTCIKKYGCENPAQNDQIKKKIKASYVKNFGVDHPMKLEEFIEKVKWTSIENNGIPYVFATEANREKARKAFNKKHGGIAEMMKKKAQEEKGVDHYMQDPEVFERCMKSMKRKKPYTFPSGRVETVMGYEHFCIDYLLENGFEENDIEIKNVPKVWYYLEDKKRCYHPDIYIKSLNLIIEVKGDYTYICNKEVNDLKFKAVVDAGYKMNVYVMNRKGGLRKKVVVLPKINIVLDYEDYE